MLPVSFERIPDNAISPFGENFSSCVIVCTIKEFSSFRGILVEITLLDRSEAWVLIGWI